MGQLPDLLTVAQTAAMLGVADETIHRWCRRGNLAYIELPSGTKRFKREDVEAFLVPVTGGATADPRSQLTPTPPKEFHRVSDQDPRHHHRLPLRPDQPGGNP